MPPGKQAELWPPQQVKPLFVAICGAPEAGKTALAQALVRLDPLSFCLVDDARPLRLAARELYGLSAEQVETAHGKREKVEINGKTFTVRELLGRLGQALEDMHGEFIMPWMAVQWALRVKPGFPVYLIQGARMNQPIYYASMPDYPGVVIEVRRPGKAPVHEFDKWETPADKFIVNNITGLSGIEAAAKALLPALLSEGGRL